MPAAGPHSMIGQTLTGRYLVTAKLGEGGMGSVYKANDLKLDAEVVIKIPHPVLIKDPDFASRFRHEIRSLVKLSHAHIVTVMDVGTHDGLPFAVMQYLSGGSLEDWETPCEPSSLLDWLGDVADALDFMHARGLIHRDIKPANIFIDESGRACLGDFGIAKVVAAGEESDQKGLTGTGMVIGTAEYMAPEMLMPDLYQEEYDERVDQYALAVSVYEMLAGRPPFQGDTMATVAVKLAQTEPAPLHEFQQSIPQALSQAVACALAKDPQHRYANCRDFADAVSAAIRGDTTRHTSVSAQRPPVPPTARRTVAESRPNVATRKVAAPALPQRTVQERLGANQPATLQESRPTLGGTLREAIPGGVDEVFVSVETDAINVAKTGPSRIVDWVKSPVGMSSVIGGVVSLLVAGIVLSQLGGAAEEQQTPSNKIVKAAATEEIQPSPAKTAKREPPAGDEKGSSQDTPRTPPSDSTNADLAKLVKSLEPAVVRINVDLAVGTTFGNGMIVDASGLIVTNHHIVKGARKARVTFADGTTKEIEGIRLMLPDKDLAILQLAQPVGQLEVAPLAATFPKKGDFSATFGLQRGRPPSSSAGIVESIRTPSDAQQSGLTKAGTWIQTTSVISPAISGGPLVSRNGQIVGVNTWFDSTENNRNLALSSVDVREAVATSKYRQLVPLASFGRKPSIPKPGQFAGTFRTTPKAFSPSQAEKFESLWFGANGVDLSTRNQNELRRAGLRTRTGFFLTIVAYGSPAYEAGLRLNDIIKSVDGNFVSTLRDVSKVVDVAKRGQTLRVEALKYTAKRRYQAKAVRVDVTVTGVIPQSAIDYVLQAECPGAVKECLLLQLINYGEQLSDASERATQGSEKDRLRVDTLRKSGPFDPQHAPMLSDYSFVKPGIVGRADNVRVLEIVGEEYIRFQSGLTTILLSGEPTGVFVGSRANFGVVQIVETTNYTTVNGQSKRAFVAKRFDIEPYLPKGQKVGDALRVAPDPVVRQNAAANRMNLSGFWKSSNGNSIFQIVDNGKNLVVRLVSSDAVQELNGLLIRNGNVLTAQLWQGVFKKDPARKRYKLEFKATVVREDSLSIQFTNVLWDGRGREISRRFDGRGKWVKLSEDAAEAALDQLDE